MLFYAIYLRINQYDLTINRYFVVIFWIWLLTISIYFIFSKKRNLVVIPTILTLFTIIISIWPWSVFYLPEARQFKRLKENLEKAWILVNWEIHPLNTYEDIDKELSNQIYDEIYYLCHNANCKKLANLFWKEVNYSNKWSIVNEITKEIKVKNNPLTPISLTESESEYLYIYTQWSIYPINVEDYTYITEVDWHFDRSGISESEYKNLAVKVSIENDILYVIQDNEEKERILMWNLKKEIYDKYIQKNGEHLYKEDMTYEFVGQKYSVKLFIQNIEINNPKYDGVSWYDYISWYALVKEL
jgi:hypothetical protein